MNGDTRTYTYKTAGGCDIQADVHTPRGGGPHPVLVWIHGGCLMMGSRQHLADRQRQAYLRAGCAVVAIDYRLAPETKLPEIIEDLRDAFHWVRGSGPSLFDADPDRLAVVGHSAGGYLTLTSGFAVDPRPRALVSFYGYGDIVGPWYSRPDPFYCQQPLVPEEEARAAVGVEPISGTPGDHQRSRFYLYCRQHGLWPREVGGRDPDTDPDWFKRYCPDQNVTPDYPPTLLLHGDRDTDVPHELSVAMAGALTAAGVEHRLITIAGGPHGFEHTDHRDAGAAFDAALLFLKTHL